jgi:hypothetical protein
MLLFVGGRPKVFDRYATIRDLRNFGQGSTVRVNDIDLRTAYQCTDAERSNMHLTNIAELRPETSVTVNGGARQATL